jgi:DNA-binding transcriptional MerR regulator
MRIGELAARAGVNPKTIRFYEERRLLPQPARRASGYREYDEGDIARLTFVKAAQRLGLSLDEIGEVLAFKERGERPCDYVLGLLDRQVADIDGRLTELARLRSDLQALKARADCLPAEGGCYCRIIEHAQAKAR